MQLADLTLQLSTLPCKTIIKFLPKISKCFKNNRQNKHNKLTIIKLVLQLQLNDLLLYYSTTIYKAFHVKHHTTVASK